MTDPANWRVHTLLTRSKAETLVRLALAPPHIAQLVLGHIQVPGCLCGVCEHPFDYKARITPHAFIVLVDTGMRDAWVMGVCRACLEDNGLKACATTVINGLTEALRDEEERQAMQTHGPDAAKVAQELMSNLMEDRKNGRRKK